MGGFYVAKERGSSAEKSISHRLLPEVVQFYDKDKDGVLIANRKKSTGF